MSSTAATTITTTINNCVPNSSSSIDYTSSSSIQITSPLAAELNQLNLESCSSSANTTIQSFTTATNSNQALNQPNLVTITSTNPTNPFITQVNGKIINHSREHQQHRSLEGVLNRDIRPKEEAGWFNSFAGAVKRQFASYVKSHLSHGDKDNVNGSSCSGSSGSTNSHFQLNGNSAASTLNQQQRAIIDERLSRSRYTQQQSSNIPYSSLNGGSSCSSSGSSIQPPSHHHSLIDNRHRSPDPPPRYNRGQSPLLLRKDLIDELTGKKPPSPGSPLYNKRYVTASPPLPLPRRGSESVPGSPQHLRTRIHYTPEPQRRIYRTIDQ